MTATPEELLQRCEWLSKRAGRMLRQFGTLNPDFYFSKSTDPTLYQLRFDNLASWMNSGTMKQYLFSMIRIGVENAGYDFVMSATDMWAFEANIHARTLTEAQRRRFTDRGFRTLVELGFGKVGEAYSVIGQTPEHYVQLTVPYKRDLLNPEKVFKIVEAETERIGPTSMNNFKGRLKMFGDWGEPGMREMYEKVKKGLKKYEAHNPKYPKVGSMLARCVTPVNYEEF
jgi:hypothetical protein